MTGSNRRHSACKADALPTELIAHLVGEVGADPTVPEGNGFTVRRSCRFATLPYSFISVRCPVYLRRPGLGLCLLPRCGFSNAYFRFGAPSGNRTRDPQINGDQQWI